MITCAQITIRDEADIAVQALAPLSPAVDELWLDTSVTPHKLKCWSGTVWAECGTDVDLSQYYTKTQMDTKFTQTDAAIALKADSTVTDSLGNRLAAAEGSITAQAGQIAAKVSQTDFDDLTIGGRNLIRDSGLLTVIAGASQYAYMNVITGLTLNTQYALSVGHITLDAGGASSVTWRIYDLNTATAGASGSLNVSDARQTALFTTPSAEGTWSLLLYAGVYANTAGNTISFHEFKLEQGNKVTAWSLAPEDLISDIGTLNTATQTLADDIAETAVTTAEQVLAFVAGGYAAKHDVEAVSNAVNSLIQQTATDIELTFQRSKTYTIEVTGEMRTFIDTIQSYQRFSENGLELGVLGSPFAAQLGNTRLSFLQSGEEIAYISNNKLFITAAHITNRLTIGNEANGGYFDWITTQQGLALKWRSA